MGHAHDAHGSGGRARKRQRRESPCLCENCGRPLEAPRWNQRYCGEPECKRRVQSWQAAKRQERCRATREGRRRHREREKHRRRRARERTWKTLLVLLTLVVTAVSRARPAKPKKQSQAEREQLLALLLLFVLPVLPVLSAASEEDDSLAPEDDLHDSSDEQPDDEVRPNDDQPEGGYPPDADTDAGSEDGDDGGSEADDHSPRGHTPRRKNGEPFCDRPGCYGAPLIWTRWGECFCSEECRAALRRVEDRERKWLLRGIRAGVEWCGRELARRRKERDRLRDQLLAYRLRWMPGGSSSP